LSDIAWGLAGPRGLNLVGVTLLQLLLRGIHTHYYCDNILSVYAPVHRILCNIDQCRFIALPAFIVVYLLGSKNS